MKLVKEWAEGKCDTGALRSGITSFFSLIKIHGEIKNKQRL